MSDAESRLRQCLNCKHALACSARIAELEQQNAKLREGISMAVTRYQSEKDFHGKDYAAECLRVALQDILKDLGAL